MCKWMLWAVVMASLVPVACHEGIGPRHGPADLTGPIGAYAFDEHGNEPSFESVLRTMFDSGYRGDIYPSLGMWELAPTAVWASYPFSDSLKVMRSGGF